MMKALIAAFFLAATCGATDVPKHKMAPPLPSAGDARENMLFRVSFKLKDHDLSASGNLVVESGTQANYVAGGDDRSKVIVNVLPAIHPDLNLVDCQVQAELSAKPAKARPATEFQLQTEVRVPLGKTLVLVDEPDRRVEVTIEEAK